MPKHPETGPEHFAEAQRLVKHAQDVLALEPVGLMSDYPSEDDYFAAIDDSLEAHHSAEQTSLVYTGMAQVHATLALAYATAMTPGIHNGWVPGFTDDRNRDDR